MIENEFPRGPKYVILPTRKGRPGEKEISARAIFYAKAEAL
ncbi:MAG: hypothetical protein VZQ80_04720 [Lachnospiraceae bacterium]|nr:hypothetical protein [Lachnospiraceae bacterium]